MADLRAKYTQITRTKHASKILHELLHARQLHENCVYFGKGWNLLLFIHAKCVYFFTKESTGATVDFKKSLWIVGQQGQQAKLFEEANSCHDQQ